jgi:hypothetical protein
MKDSVLLSVNLGVPLAVIAVVLLFRAEANQLSDRVTSWLVWVAIVVVTLAVATLAISRFVFLA